MRIILEGNDNEEKRDIVEILKDKYQLEEIQIEYEASKFKEISELLVRDDVIFTKFLITDLVYNDILKKPNISPVDAQMLLSKAASYGYKIFTLINAGKIYNSVGRDIQNSYTYYSDLLKVPTIKYDIEKDLYFEIVEEIVK